MSVSARAAIRRVTISRRRRAARGPAPSWEWRPCTSTAAWSRRSWKKRWSASTRRLLGICPSASASMPSAETMARPSMRVGWGIRRLGDLTFLLVLHVPIGNECFAQLLRRGCCMTWYDIVAAAALAGWLYLIAARGAFWLASVRDDASPSLQAPWPTVVAVVPARDEASCVAQSIGSLLDQSYPGTFSVILVDDQSDDDTAVLALRAAQTRGASDRLSVVSGQTLPAGWMGKTWAQQQGIELALRQSPSYLLLTRSEEHTPE